MARARFDVYINKNKTIDRFLNSLCFAPEDGRRLSVPVLAYGDGNFPVTGKGEEPVPVKFIWRRARQLYRVVMIDEYRTTRVCHHCKEESTSFVRLLQADPRAQQQEDGTPRNGEAREVIRQFTSVCGVCTNTNSYYYRPPRQSHLVGEK